MLSACLFRTVPTSTSEVPTMPNIPAEVMEVVRCVLTIW